MYEGKVCAAGTNKPRRCQVLHCPPSGSLPVLSVRRGAWWPASSLGQHSFFLVNKGSLADKSGATGQREQGEGGWGLCALFFLVKGHFTACCYHNNRLQRKGGGGVRHKVSLLPARHPALGLLWDNDYQSPDPGGGGKGSIVEIVPPQMTK